MSRSEYEYVEVAASGFISDLRWDVPRRNAGQIVEVAYSAFPPSRGEADHGDKYKRVYDASTGDVRYFERRPTGPR
jgi:hypothetical protein